MVAGVRSSSVGLPGRFGNLFSEDNVVCNAVGIKAVMRNTFWELDVDDTHVYETLEVSDNASCCGSEIASESTAAISKSDDSKSDDSDMIDDEAEPMSFPPGNFSSVSATWVRHAHVMMGAVSSCSTVATTKEPSDHEERVRHSGPVWGSRKKRQTQELSYSTILIKSLPAKCTNAMVLDLLDNYGFKAKYDFVYVPNDFRNYSAFGYAFVNMVSHQMADLAIEKLDGVSAWNQAVPLDVDWSLPHQGFATQVRRYQNSPVMHHAVPQEYKPMIFRNGIQQKFPEPTRKIKEPRLRRGAVPGSV